MNTTQQLAKHLREVHLGGNWTWVNLKDTLADVSWQQATIKVPDCNTIATLVFHINYFIAAVIPVFRGEPLNAKDAYSFAHPPITGPADWQAMLDKTFAEAETLAGLVEQLPDEQQWDVFCDPKYGNYFRNIMGIIEHTHYHMGQIVILKKVLGQAVE